MKSAARKSPIANGKLPPVSGEEYATLKARYEEMAILCNGLSKDMKLLEARLKELLFGRRKTEKWDPNQGLLPIGDLVQSAPESKLADDASSSNQEDPADEDAGNEPKKKRKHKGRNAISPLLERRDVKCEMSVEELDSLYGVGNWTAIGQETSESLDSTPSSLFVVRRIRIRYGSVDHTSPPVIASADAVLPKCKASSGLLSRIITSKYSDGLPLYRQSSIFKREGVEISRSTMTGWMEGSAKLLWPIAHAVRDMIVESGFVTADETPIVVLDRSHKQNKFKGYLWGYMGRGGDVYYDFRNSRSRDGPDEILADLVGILQSDGYVAYGSFAKDKTAVTLAGCWVHVRRGFQQCSSAYPLECTEALGIIRQIYRVETELRNRKATDEEILSTRAERTEPLINAFEKFLAGEFPEVTPTSALGKALSYARNRMPTLRVFLRDASMTPDTNHLERCMKHAALLRKNFLFFGSENGGRFGAVLLTLAFNCKLLDINAWKYFKWALEMSSSRNPPAPEAMTPKVYRDAHQQAD